MGTPEKIDEGGRARSLAALRASCPHGKRKGPPTSGGTHWKSAKTRAAAIERLRENRDKPRFAPIKIPPHAHPLARQLFDLMNATQTTKTELAEAIGCPRETLFGWRDHLPRLDILIAAFNHLDHDLCAVPLEHGRTLGPPDPVVVLGRSIDARTLAPAQRATLRFLAREANYCSLQRLGAELGFSAKCALVYLSRLRKVLAPLGLRIDHPWCGGYKIVEGTPRQ